MALNTYASKISQALVAAAEVSIPHTSKVGCNKNKSIPGWTEFIKPLKAKSLFWHNVWVDCHRPMTDAVADVMKRTRALYHYAITRFRRSERNIINERFADAMLVDNNRDFWSEVKRLRSNKTFSSNMIDDFTSPCDIANFFVSKYQDLYTSVKFDKAKMDIVRGDNELSLLDHGFTNESIVTFKEVQRAIDKLNSGKGNAIGSLKTDHFKNSNRLLSVHVSLFLSGVIAHGTLPDDFQVSTVIQIPKGRNVNLSDSSNYTGIVLSSIYGKMFDQIIVSCYADKLCTSDLQFGFKRHRSTNMCTMVLKEAIAYYVNNGSSVFCTLLDATKAFDRVEYVRLFKLLMWLEIFHRYLLGYY